jgi:hypothetical protein
MYQFGFLIKLNLRRNLSGVLSFFEYMIFALINILRISGLAINVHFGGLMLFFPTPALKLG